MTRSTRRRFVKTVGATGALSGLSGLATAARQGQTTIQWAGNPVDKQNVGKINQALHNAGLPQNINIEVIVTSNISDDVQQQYRQWLQAGRNQPDILRMDSGWTIPFIARGQIANLNQELSQSSLNRIKQDNFTASVNTASAPNGDLYAVPYFTDLPTIQYRKDWVTNAGFDPDGQNWATEPISWKRFSNVISKTQQQQNTQYGYSWQASAYEGLSCCTFNELMTTWGGAYFGGRDNLFGPVGERPITVNEQPVIQALRMGRTFIHGQQDQFSMQGYQQISPQAVLQWTEGPSQSAFMNENAVAMRWWPSGLYDAAQKFGDRLGVMPIPYGVRPNQAKYEGTGGTAAALGGWHLALNPNSQNKQAAVQVLNAVAKVPFREFEFRTLGYVPPDNTYLQSQRAQQVSIWGNYLDTLRLAGETAIPRPVTVVWPDESTAIADRVNGALAQQQAPQPAMSALQSTLQDIEGSL
ncbi:extracellular solute-binding protein [Haladaptatus salinisoli]|uniref:extracellular solute-binding protein n=1 Tax=Haladaptatus salinisoli TaxID=2884876 RepID=UPI001D0B64D0|nr:extracellular solute-binding protein [Haladaptatus salinisoli]